MTTSKTLEEYKKSLPMDLLPQNFLDAILVTRKLGLRYLWIDALCIVQYSLADWEAEAARMGSVYSNAAVTISALRSKDSKKGFLGRRNQCCVILSSDFAAHRPLPGFDAAVSKSPLSKRGWCLQERLLSPALLNFGAGQMYWECRTATWQEDGLPFEPLRYSFEYSFTDTRRVFGLTGPRSARDWYVLVEDFSGRALTYRKDRLPALAGIASRFRAAGIGGRYVAGHWMEGLEKSLFWMSYCDPVERPWYFKPVGRDPPIPTWSWASVGTTVNFKSDEEAGNSLLQILAATALKVTLTIRGHVATMRYVKHTRKNGMNIAMPETEKPGLRFYNETSARAVLRDFPGEGRTLGSQRYSVLLDSRHQPRMLVMRQVRTISGKREEEKIPVFHRVGSAEYLGEHLEDEVLARFKKQTIILV
ncbi:heterokaryon incompatibility protein [Colletotrichum musicola]|uniref:Heterokaryon incompatibility protein n=1 Tax=Colletotrichum musicola TaxID=2175873 RepID=A0A8H6KHJ6_9PEZI|nr:heterokaryon incompatibility protein [Colletotrichum musicola]